MKWEVALLVIMFLAIGVRLYEPEPKVLAAKVEEIQPVVKTEQWQKIVEKHPTYRDGYVQLAIGSWQAGRNAEAQVWLGKALEVDPNFQLSPTLQALLVP